MPSIMGSEAPGQTIDGRHFLISMGAHNHAYSEMTYKGDRGDDQSFVWTASDAARQGRFGNGFAVMQEIHGDQWPDPQKAEIAPDWVDMVETQRFRRETVVTTYTVIQVPSERTSWRACSALGERPKRLLTNFATARTRV
jgi:hypothetical protein